MKFCLAMQMAARETGIGAVESLLHEGKLLALDLLYRILENPLHVWNNVRPEVCNPPPSSSHHHQSLSPSSQIWTLVGSQTLLAQTQTTGGPTLLKPES